MWSLDAKMRGESLSRIQSRAKTGEYIPRLDDPEVAIERQMVRERLGKLGWFKSQCRRARRPGMIRSRIHCEMVLFTLCGCVHGHSCETIDSQVNAI